MLLGPSMSSLSKMYDFMIFLVEFLFVSTFLIIVFSPHFSLHLFLLSHAILQGFPPKLQSLQSFSSLLAINLVTSSVSLPTWISRLLNVHWVDSVTSLYWATNERDKNKIKRHKRRWLTPLRNIQLWVTSFNIFDLVVVTIHIMKNTLITMNT